MTSLDSFREQQNVSPGKGFEAFRMDNTKKADVIPDMRTYVGLGSCNCCDYFLIHENKVVLVEETQLADTIKTIEKKYSYLAERHRQDFTVDCVRQENYLKVFGALLVLWRLAAKCREASSLMQDKKHDFYLVITGMETEEARRMFDNLKDNLQKQLQSVLTPEVMDNVEVIPSREILADKLSH
ncbi:MAG: hypothetical protein OXI88_10860 [Gammaproteobacteria bacterium]|nr:hypothetical protein [Gammaproteobacteria bacterium]MDE0283537.1 hypothetical protein [Gammaproteobacteria bacterium]MDE0512272.1 hypothetical protein [Gammaproteobacteria bacterium]